MVGPVDLFGLVGLGCLDIVAPEPIKQLPSLSMSN